jgi:RimJ/RimL family protein N-acetyltransferase
MSNNNPVISTPRLLLREWVPSDTAPFIAMNSDAEVMQYFPSVLTANETCSMIERIMEGFTKNKFGLYALEEKATGHFIGFTGFAIPSFESSFTPCIEIGWRLQKASWGRGFATEAATACLEYGFKKLQFPEVHSFTATVNRPSENLMKKLGMKKTSLFNHPRIESGNWLCQHVLYNIKNPL